MLMLTFMLCVICIMYILYMLCTPCFAKVMLHRRLSSFKVDECTHAKILFDVADSLEKSQIFFWLGEGTALGAIRQQTIIPGDGDVDIGMYTGDKARFIREVLPELVEKGFSVGRRFSPYTLYRDNHYIDIDFTSHGGKCAAIRWLGNCDNVLGLLEPFQQCTINNRAFLCPSMRYIVRLYGGDWQTPKPDFKPL